MINELDVLIEEQAREMARGPRQSREEFVVMSIDDTRFDPSVPIHVDTRRYKGCAIHGKTFMVRYGMRDACKVCRRDYAREWARRKRAKQRKGGERP